MLLPAAWKVPMSGAVLKNIAVWVGPGHSGSCRWTTSNASSRSARIVRSCADRSGAIGATDPLAAVGTLLPSGVTPASGGGPSHGPSTRTSWPAVRSARANPRIWPWTPPGSDRL